MSSAYPESRRARPYFLPSSIEFESLSTGMKYALETIIAPVYEDLVVSASSSLERIAGVTVVYLLTQELFEQCALGQVLPGVGGTALLDPDSREKSLRVYFRLAGAKTNAINVLLRIRQLSPRSFIHVEPAA